MLFDIRQTTMMERKTRYEVQELLVAEYETDGSMKFITGEDLELWYRDKIKGTVRPEKLEFDEALQEAFLQSSYRGDFDELEVGRISTRKIYRNASGQN